MDRKKIAWLVMVFAGATLAGLWYLNKQAAERNAPGGGKQAVAPPAGAASSAPSTRPAGPASTAPAASRPAASRPAAGEDIWQQDLAGLGTQEEFLAGSLDPNSGYLMRVQFHREGASIYTLKLTSVFATVADKLLFERLGRHEKRYESERRKDPKTYQGHYSLLNPVSSFGRRHLPYATRRITVMDADGNIAPTAIYLDSMKWQHLDTRAVTQPSAGQEVKFRARLYRNGRPALQLIKTYLIPKKDYSIVIRLAVENLSDRDLKVLVDQLGATGVPREEHFRFEDDRFAVYGRLQPDDKNVNVVQDAIAKIQAGETDDNGQMVYKVPTGAEQGLGRSDEAAPVLWVGLANKFFASMMYVRPTIQGRLAAPAWQADFDYLAAHETPTSRTFVTGVRLGDRKVEQPAAGVPDMVLQAGGGTKEMVFDVFAGPKKRDMLSESGSPLFRPLYKDLNYLGTINFRSCFCSWNALTLGMMWLLQKISVVTLGNYGLAIIILVILVRVVLHPLTKKSQVSMSKMQKLQPEMARLKKKYADDKEALQKEMMKFYKQQGATPLVGCLPMLLQMPIWIALWTSLNAAFELRHAAFLPIWLTDLAAPDGLISWSTPVIIVPLLGGMIGPIASFNFLPLLLTVAMFYQTKLNPQMTQTSAAATPEQEKQQKMMKIMMPVMMLLFFYNAPSGLTLYIMTSTFAGVLEQYVIRKHIETKEAAQAAAVTTVKVPGKGPRDGRPKKAKGPFWMKRG